MNYTFLVGVVNTDGDPMHKDDFFTNCRRVIPGVVGQGFPFDKFHDEIGLPNPGCFN